MKELPARLLFWTLLAAIGTPSGTGASASPRKADSPEVLDMGSRLELFVDRHLIETMDGVELELGQPQPREKVFQFDQPWEGNTPAHIAIFRDGDVYRMYYRGSAHNDYIIREELLPGEKIVPQHPKVSCYAESRDGIRWTRPSLGQVEFQGSRDNNILDLGGATKFNPFRDENPEAPESARYKGIGFYRTVPGAPPHSKQRGLVPLQSPDGVHWTWMAPEPVITDGYFDSHNVAFWDGVRGHYVALYRDFAHGVRTLKYATSKDFVEWSEGRWVDYGDAPQEHLYTNATVPYFRAPHIYVAFPKRFVPWRAPQHYDYASATERPGLSEGVFMSSRDGLHWHRFLEAFIRPGRNRRNWIHRTNFVGRGIIRSADDEISLYVTRHYTYPSVHIRRMSLRLDGFVSVSAGHPGGEFTTRPLIFQGENLVLNYATAAAGSIQVEIQDAGGNPLAGFALQDSIPIWGDEIEGVARWRRAGNRGRENQLRRLAGMPVRLRFVMTDADLFSLRFR